jgi:hypothetical protein
MDERPTAKASWQQARATNKRSAAAAALDDAREQAGAPKQRRIARWYMSRPADFDATLAALLREGAPPAVPRSISWITMKKIQAWDQDTHAVKGVKLMHLLTPAHFERTNLSRMNVGLAIDVFRRETARMLRYLRSMYK